MTSVAAPFSRPRIVYPDTDGAPLAENTLQFEWIMTIKGGLDYLFAGAPDVFVAGDLFWYPVEGHPEIVAAPDAMVAFGRPKGHRLSYMQWEEGGVPPQVVFEVLSPSNRRLGEMLRKFEFYRRHGVEEYYIYDPDPRHVELSGFLRRGDDLVEISSMNGHVRNYLKSDDFAITVRDERSHGCRGRRRNESRCRRSGTRTTRCGPRWSRCWGNTTLRRRSGRSGSTSGRRSTG